jgi:hypothetical protein
LTPRKEAGNREDERPIPKSKFVGKILVPSDQAKPRFAATLSIFPGTKSIMSPRTKRLENSIKILMPKGVVDSALQADPVLPDRVTTYNFNFLFVVGKGGFGKVSNCAST